MATPCTGHSRSPLQQTTFIRRPSAICLLTSDINLAAGFQLYVMLIEVFEAEKSRIRWYYLAAYGLPALVVGVSCIIDATSYGTADFCWLATDNYFILAFVGPVVLVILVSPASNGRCGKCRL